jgi:predicted dehydrogenase
MQKVNWGIIGCGDVAEIKSGPAFQKAENSHLLAVMRRDGVKAKDFAQRHGVEFWYDNVDALLKNEAINAVYIATPPSTHLQYALDALQAGKHVYLEKPMVLNKAEGLVLLKAFNKVNTKLTVAHYRRFLPAFLKVKELLEANTIGAISFADINFLQPQNSNVVAQSEENWRVNATISGGGLFHDLAPHQIDLMYYFFGDILQYEGFSSSQESEHIADVVSGNIHFKNDIQFRGIWCFNVAEASKRDNCTIYGSDGEISFSFYGDKVMFNINGKTSMFEFENPVNIQLPMIQQTVDYFIGKANNPCSLEEGLMVTKILDRFSSH